MFHSKCEVYCCLNVYNLQIAVDKYLPCIVFRALGLNWFCSQNWEDQQGNCCPISLSRNTAHVGCVAYPARR
jgi:hypothetical protein